MDSFSWEDFPVVAQNDYSFVVLLKSDNETTRTPNMMELSSTSSSSSEDDSLVSEEDDSVTMLPSLREKRRVKFAPWIEMRTHSITLGDHPLCEVLPLSLGWEYDQECIHLETHEQSKKVTRYCNSGPSRLSYLERKHRLVHVAGFSSQQLMNHVTTMKHGTISTHVADA
jgi:hypothetical protein